jgi:predicted dehydrogenase
LEGLDLVSAAWSATPPEARPILMVGFNRRFSPLTQVAKELLASSSGPKTFSMMVNAGALPREHWAHDPLLGGGRIIGEACHFIDLLRYLADAPLSGWDGSRMRSSTEDTASLQLEFEDGSIGTVHYWANGSKAFPKERLEVFAGGRILQLDNFRRLRTFGWGRSKSLLRQDKGQRQCASAFIDAVRRGTVSPTPFDELIEVTRVAIELA